MKNFFNKQFTTLSFKIKSYKHEIINLLTIKNILQQLKKLYLFLLKKKYYLLPFLLIIIDYFLIINYNFSILIPILKLYLFIINPSPPI